MNPSSFHVLVTAAHWAPEAQAQVQAAGGQIHFMTEPITEDHLIARLQETGAQVLLVRGIKPVSARVLQAAPALRLVAKNGAGVDGIDLDAARARGVAVAVAPGANARAVAEHAVAMMLSLTRQLPLLDCMVRAGQWAPSTWQGRDFRDATVGIIGYGAIGKGTAQLAAALGARVLVLRPHGQADGFATEPDLHQFLPQVNILSLHCPLTERTRGLIGARELALLPQGSILINTARGPVVNEAALINALQTGHLEGAGLDTFDTEPIPASHPLTQLPNALLTPHVAGVTQGASLRVSTITAQNIVDHLTGAGAPAQHRVA